MSAALCVACPYLLDLFTRKLHARRSYTGDFEAPSAQWGCCSSLDGLNSYDRCDTVRARYDALDCTWITKGRSCDRMQEVAMSTLCLLPVEKHQLVHKIRVPAAARDLKLVDIVKVTSREV